MISLAYVLVVCKSLHLIFMKKLKCSFVFIIAFLLFTSSSVNHEYYVSVTKIEYVKKENHFKL